MGLNKMSLSGSKEDVMAQVRALIERSEKDRYALIISEEDEAFTNAHMPEVYTEYRCSGILVRQTCSGVAYHKSSVKYRESILTNGFYISQDEWLTFGGGVLYTYPTMAPFEILNASVDIDIWRVEYGPGSLRSIATIDKEEILQGEICIFPEQILHYELYKTIAGSGDSR